ncbi:acyltransferase [Nemorincola caseinilytica]|uniref:Acyltransferase n=1 Tax=Nemorincola caseinilytica TaxID=2054315 RepID=A0ABP8NC50_9BACT
MNNAQAVTKERFHFIDGLRGIASILIVLHHSVTSAIARFFIARGHDHIGTIVTYFTQSGVVLFFTLSGIVLLRPYLRGERKFKVGEYFVRRIKRIYPAFFVALVFGYLVLKFIAWGPQTFYSDMWGGMDTSFQKFLQQALILSMSGVYFNLAWWSLQIEVVFYILVPLFVLAFSFRKQLNYLYFFINIAAVVIGSHLLQLYFEAHHPEIYSLSQPVLNMVHFIDAPVSFVLGVYLAKYDFKPYAGWVLVAAGVPLVLLPPTGPLINSGYSLIYGGLLIFAFNSKKLRSLLDTPIMIWLGERSYSLFLVHFSVFYLVNYICSMFLPDRNMLYGILTRGAGIPLAFLCAMTLFYFVERRQARGLVTDRIFWPWQLRRLNKDALKDK